MKRKNNLREENRLLQKIIQQAETNGYEPFCPAVSLCNYDADVMMSQRFYLDKKFAQAFFGESWEFWLQGLVLDDFPINFLAHFI